MTQKVVVAVCTKQRPLMLERCLKSLAELNSTADIDVHICVVENDCHENMRSLVSSLSDQYDTAMHYVLETVTGIPYARNKALEYAKSIGGHWLLFVDDDECVPQTWLMDILGVATQYEASVAVGPVIHRYPEESVWGSCLYAEKNRKKKEDGQEVRSAATNNVAISSSVFSDQGLALTFDESFRFTGGSDTDFFNRAKDLGAKLVWAQSAAVYEEVPMERCTLKWAFSRSSRIASAAVCIDAKNIGRAKATQKHLRRALQDVGKFVGYMLLSILSLLTFRSVKEPFFKAWQGVARLWGRLWGVAGGKMSPYRRIDGS